MQDQVKEQQDVPDGVQDRLWAMVEHAGSQLTQQMKELYAVLLEYHNYDLFAQGSTDFGCTGVIKHNIDTGEAKPTQQQIHRISPHKRDKAKKLL